MKRDYLAWAALAAAIAVTASAEYALARACGFGPWVAVGVPGALDIYAIRALRARRDVLAVVVAMIGVNAASHLVTAGLLPVSVPLVVAVSAIAPLVLWRVHALREEPVSSDVNGDITEHPAADGPDVPAAVPVVERVPAPVPDVPEAYPEITAGVPEDAPPVPEDGPAAAAVYPADVPARTRVTAPVPEDELIARARAEFAGLLAEGRTPTIRALRSTLRVGQDRAKAIKQLLAEEIA